MPVVELAGPFMQGRTVEDEVVRGASQNLVHPSKAFREDGCEELELGFLAFLEIAGVALGEDPHFEGKPRRKGREADEFRILRHQAVSVAKLLPDNVAVDTPFFLLEVGSAAVDLFHDAGGNDGERDQLRMAVFQGGSGGGAVIFEDEDIDLS